MTTKISNKKGHIRSIGSKFLHKIHHKHREHHTRAESDDENVNNSQYRSASNSRPSSRQDQDYLLKGHEAMEKLVDMLNDKEGWNLEKDKPGIGTVRSRYDKASKRKIYKLDAIVETTPHILWKDTILELASQPDWNPTVLEAKTLQVIDDSTEINYTIANEAAGGIVSARDFINVRHWVERDNGVYHIALTGVKYDDMPEQKKYVRGENGPSGMAFSPVDGEPDKCFFEWILNSNLKGWIPQTVIDTGLTGVLFSYLENMNKHIIELNKAS